jgi:hypothetical protein
MTSERPARLRALVARGVPFAACGILAAACGSTVAPASNSAGAPAGPAGTQSPAPAPSPTATSGSGTSTPGTTAPPSEADISITVTGANGHWTLRCEPPSGNVPDPQTACERLLAQPALFSPPARHMMCPQLMRDAPGYVVSGTFLGQHVSRAILDGGCDLAKWSVLHEIFQ